MKRLRALIAFEQSGERPDAPGLCFTVHRGNIDEVGP
jgi:hypothetical protein